MADPLGWAGAFAAKYGPTTAGLAIGTAAKYGLTLSEGRPLTWRGALADLLLLGLLGLIAILISDWAGLTGNARVLAGALAAVASDRLVRLVRDRVLQGADRKLTAALDLPPDTQAEVRTVPGTQPVITVNSTPGVPMRRALRQAFPPPTDHDPVADHLLGKLGDDI